METEMPLPSGPLEPAQTMHRSTATPTTLIALLALAFVGPLHAEDTKANDVVKASTDIVAAKVCDERGFEFMTRLSPEYVMCLPIYVGGPARIVAVRDVLARAPR